MKNRKLPQHIKNLFWDTNREALDGIEHQWAIIEQVMMRGNKQQILWLIKKYGIEEIIKNLQNNYNYSPYRVKFWAFILNFDYTSAKCMNKPLQFHIFG